MYNSNNLVAMKRTCVKTQDRDSVKQVSGTVDLC